MMKKLCMKNEISMLRLFSGVFHDLNNILGCITSNLSFLINKSDKSSHPIQYTQELKKLLKISERAVFLINNVMTIIKNNSEPVFLPLNIKEILFDITFMLKNMYKDSGIQIKLKDFNHLPLIYGDGNLLYQALLNICLNGIESMENTPIKTLTIYAEKTKKNIKIVIEDTGEGIDKKIQKKIFEPFFSTKTGPKFKGLGLYITKSIITTHKGKIKVTSEPNKGTRFEIFLPIYTTTHHINKGKKITKFESRAKILIIDNDERFLESIKKYFLKKHCEPVCAHTYNELTRILKYEKVFDLVLLSVSLFNKKIETELKTICANDKKPKIILLTTQADKDVLPFSLYKSIDDVIQKPFKPDKLLSKIQNIIEGVNYE